MSGFESWFPAEHIFPEEDEEFSATLKAVRHARSHLAAIEVNSADSPDLYYLV